MENSKYERQIITFRKHGKCLGLPLLARFIFFLAINVYIRSGKLILNRGRENDLKSPGHIMEKAS